ncbi:uncharacterized protein LOC127707516 [Mytilus californianus]|uniref:uncharacterized protein LOC127707516 n=1 Tax=Mytilus californianus TaxID=6549 RepID=UPI00224787AF|nr:uncharacterized protein LOC127707516 [Mytilus californianus]
MAKRKLNMDSLTGYLHNVSTVTLSANGKTKYFTGTFQMTKTDTKRLVCFAHDKHEKFVSAATMNSPVKLTGATLSPGRSGQIDVICNKSTTLQVAMNELTFKKQKIQTNDESEPKDLINLSENMTATIYVKIVKFIEEEMTIPTKYGMKQRRQAICADNTACKKMSLWGHSIAVVEEGKYYKIKNVISNNFNDEMWINTCATTKITEIDNYGQVMMDHSLLLNELKQISIGQITVTKSTKCSNQKCMKAIEVTSADPTIKCDTCKMKQRVQNLHKSTKAVINTTDNISYTIFEPQLKSFLEAESQQDLIEDCDSLEDYILNVNNFSVEINQNNNILSFARCAI